MSKPKAHYVDSNELEKIWANWLATECPKSWDDLQTMVYRICQGIVVHFNPKDEEEHMDLSHETFMLTIDKIKRRKLTFIPGKAPVFNLLTTTIFRHLYSLKNRENRRKKLLMTKYLCRPGVLENVICASDFAGATTPHPDSERILSSLMPQVRDETAKLSASAEKNERVAAFPSKSRPGRACKGKGIGVPG
jgi:hypothetical protein